MPFKGKAPLTISLIQPCVPGLAIDSISRENPLPLSTSSSSSSSSSSSYSSSYSSKSPSDVVVARLTVSDVRGNKMSFVSKRSKWHDSFSDFTAAAKFQDLSSRHNECNFYLHYSSLYSPLPLPRCWSIKAPAETAIGNVTGGDVGKYTNFTLLLSDVASAVNFSRADHEYLDYYQTVAALKYLAKFHAVMWESKDEGGKIWARGGRGGGEAAGGEGSWGELSEKLAALAGGVGARIEDGLARGRKHRTVVHGDFVSASLLFVPNVEGAASDLPQVAATSFKRAGKGYGMFDVATLLCSSVDPSLLLHDQREEEFLGVYFNELQSSLKEARKPPLPPGYKWEDCMSSYELCILDHCAELHLREDSGSEYACLRCGEVVERLEKTVDTNSNDLSASQWKSVIFNQFP